MYFKLVVLSCLLALSQAGILPPNNVPIAVWNEVSPYARIIGGHDAQISQFPYIISVQCFASGKNIYFCGGSIINSRWIVTAAHCIKIYFKECDAGSLFIRAGKHNIQITEPYEQLAKVEKHIVHEKFQFDLSISENDIALLKLEKPLQINKYVRPIRLPKSNTEPSGNAVVAGWGWTQAVPAVSPNILQTVNVTIVNREICNVSISLVNPSETANLHETNICTGPLSGGVATCGGDSGGPVIVNVYGQEELVGVVCWGFLNCGIKNGPSVHVKVADYVDWIINKIVKN